MVPDELLLITSTSGTFEGSAAFAGYGIVAPEAPGQPGYDSYQGLDVKDKWVVVLRFVPEELESARRQYLSGYSALSYKAMQAKAHGALGMIVVSGPTSGAKKEVVPMGRGRTVPDFSAADVKGMKIADAKAGGPAHKAGLRGGDVIIEVGGLEVSNLEEYAQSLRALKIGEKVKVVVLRSGEKLEYEVTPESRQ